MKTLKSILFYCYVNMILLAFVLLAISHFVFGLPWKFEFIPLAMWIVVTAAITYPIKCLRFVRIVWWASVKHQFIMKLSGANPLLAYPGTIFLELSCHDIFLDGGFPAVAKALMEHLEKTRENLLGAMDELSTAFSKSSQSTDPAAGETLRNETTNPLKIVESVISPELRQQCDCDCQEGCACHGAGTHCHAPA